LNAFSEREPDERMRWLYDEIINAKQTLCDSKKFKGQMILSKWLLYLKNLMERVEERLNRRDLSDQDVWQWEIVLTKQMIEDIKKEYYNTSGLKRKDGE